MSLFPGGSEPDLAGFRYSLDDLALADSMALVMEQELVAVYQGVKKVPLPTAAAKDMRLLFVAVARGILKYLSQSEVGNITAQQAGFPLHTHQVHFAIDLKQP